MSASNDSVEDYGVSFPLPAAANRRKVEFLST